MSTDPLWEKYLGWNAYQYSMNNPVSFLDANGLWLGWYHKKMTLDALNNRGFTDEQINAIVKGNLAVDSDQKNQYKHGMISTKDIIDAEGNIDLARDEAQKEAERFIDENIKDFEQNGNLEALGAALHTIQDQIAPSHSGYQVWHSKGLLNRKNWRHIWGDLRWRNEDAYQKALEATNELLDKLRYPKLEDIEGEE